MLLLFSYLKIDNLSRRRLGPPHVYTAPRRGPRITDSSISGMGRKKAAREKKASCAVQSGSALFTECTLGTLRCLPRDKNWGSGGRARIRCPYSPHGKARNPMLACFSGKKWGSPRWLSLGRKASRPGLDWRWPDAVWTLGIVGLERSCGRWPCIRIRREKRTLGRGGPSGPGKSFQREEKISGGVAGCHRNWCAPHIRCTAQHSVPIPCPETRSVSATLLACYRHC